MRRSALFETVSRLEVDPGEREVSSRRGAILLVLSLAVLIINLDGTILNVALPSIVSRLQASSSQLQWIVDAYVVVLAGLLLVAGSLGDHIGRKKVFLAGLVIFAVGSTASALSASPLRLILARSLMGVGAAAIMPSTLSILTNVYTGPRDRARAIGLWSGTNGMGLAIGPVVGGWLLAHFWWGSVFLINVPIAVVVGVAAVFLVPDSRNLGAKRPDPLGAMMSLMAPALLLWGIIDAPMRGWGSPLIVAALVIALLLTGTLVLWERRTSHPMLELGFFRSRRFSVAVAGLALTIFALSGGLFLLTQYLQFCLGYSALQTGLRITPIAVILLVVASLSSLAVRWVGTKIVVFVGMVCIASGLAMLAFTTVHSTYMNSLPSFILMGVGSGLCVAPCTESVMGSVPPELSGVGSATNSTALQIGSALGVAVLGSLLNTRYQDRLTELFTGYSLPASIRRASESSLGGALEVARRLGGNVGAQLGEAAKASYISGMVFAVSIGAALSGFAAVVVLFLLPSKADVRR
ncbi:MAG: MFS transporter [Acidimicrobiales bacterium]